MTTKAGSQTRLLETLKARGKNVPTTEENSDDDLKIQNNTNLYQQNSKSAMLPKVGRPRRERAEPLEAFGTNLPMSLKKRFQKACVLLEEEQQNVIAKLITAWLDENEPEYRLK